jgi:Domain of unknown function (DUF4160)
MGWTGWTHWMLPRVLPPTAGLTRLPAGGVMTGRVGKIVVGADDLPLLRDHDRDVFRRSRSSALPRRHASGSAKVRIDVIEVLDSSLDLRQLRLVLAWAEIHRAELLENWRLARAGETLNAIEPLQ